MEYLRQPIISVSSNITSVTSVVNNQGDSSFQTAYPSYLVNDII